MDSLSVPSLIHLAQDNPKLKAAIFRAEAKSEEACRKRGGRDSQHLFKVHPDFHNSSDFGSESQAESKSYFFKDMEEFHEPHTIDRERILQSPSE